MREFTTERLIISPLGERHGPLLFDAFSAPAIYQFIDDEPPLNADTLAADYQRRSLGAPNDSGEIWLNWAIRLQSTVTYIGRLEATISNDNSCTLAYVLDSAYWRQGFAKEACEVILNFIRDEHSISQFVIETNSRNAGSIALAKSLGFDYAATSAVADTTEFIFKRT